MILLDTHVWIWLVEHDERRLVRRTRSFLERADARGLLRVSPISFFEVTALHVNGSLHLARPAAQWIQESLERGNIRIADLTPSIAIDAGHIPATALGDPADRFLVATARQLDATLVTADRAILAYGGAGHVRVHDASR